LDVTDEDKVEEEKVSIEEESLQDSSISYKQPRHRILNSLNSPTFVFPLQHQNLGGIEILQTSSPNIKSLIIDQI